MLKEYIENHKEEIITIPMENIALTEKIHNHGKFTPTDKPSENIKCVVTTDNRYNFVRKNLKTYHIGKIKIPEEFVNHPPRPEKVQQKIDYYNEYGQFRRKLRIDKTGTLYDGYATYLAAKQLGLKQVPVKCVK